MKQFGLEFIVKDQASRTLRNLNNQIQTLERSMKSIIPVASKFEKTISGMNVNSSVNQINRLNGALRNYNSTLKQIGKVDIPKVPNAPKQTSSGGSGGGSFMDGPPSMKNWIGADYFRDISQQFAGSLGNAFSNLPLGDIMGNTFSTLTEGIITSIATGSVAPAVMSMLTAGVDAAVGIYNKSSELVHNAIYSAFEKGSQLVSNVLMKSIPQMLDRGYDIEKLAAVLNDDALAKRLTSMGVDYAKKSSLSLQDMDFILPNLAMANMASGVKNADIEKVLEKQMDAVVRLNFKDSGQGAGVRGSLVAIQEMLSGDYISLKRRFEMSGASVDRIKSAEQQGGVMGQMEQLINELESMGVTNGALDRVRGTTKAKLEFVSESITDFLTNPSTGIFATMIKPFEGAIDNVVQFFDSGGGMSGQYAFNEQSRVFEELTKMEAATSSIQQVFGKLGEIGMQLGESFLTGFVANVDWTALWGAVSGLLDTISTYFQPAFEILAQWVNETFVPWLQNMNVLLQDENVRQGILDYIKGLTEVATNSLNMIEKITEHMPTIASTTSFMSKFVDGVIGVVDSIVSSLERAKEAVKFTFKGGAAPTPQWTIFQKKDKKSKGKKNAKGNPFVPVDDYPALLHRGERVLTAQQNKQYKNRELSGGLSISKIADTVVIREESDIDKLAKALVQKLHEEKQVYGGAF